LRSVREDGELGDIASATTNLAIAAKMRALIVERPRDAIVKICGQQRTNYTSGSEARQRFVSRTKNACWSDDLG